MLSGPHHTFVAFEEWTGAREVSTLGTNAGAPVLPFQGWRRFKEAFAPELVQLAIDECGQPRRVIDPFGGSGTTALAAQFLGVRPSTIEVNPFLADLIEAKICRYDMDILVRSFAQVADAAHGRYADPDAFLASAPKTFIEPGVSGRFLFSRDVAGRFCAYRAAIEAIANPEARRLLKVLLGATAVPASNAVISGKGRRYRRQWETSPIRPNQVDEMFEQAVLGALFDLRRYESRRCRDYDVLKGDARERVSDFEQADLAIFSPPYPNSFDYTDVYNIELWMMGYLQDGGDNRALRESTLRSHVQIKRDFDVERGGFGPRLSDTLGALELKRDELWNRQIPAMIAAYFADIHGVITALGARLPRRGRIYMVVGDSRYAGVDVPVAAILAEQEAKDEFRLVRCEPFRSMRASPQQGGAVELPETLLVLERL